MKRSIFKRLNIPKKPILPGLILAFVVIAIAVLIMIYFADREISRQSATAPIEILSVIPAKYNDGKKSRDGFQINYRFRVNGRTISGFEKGSGYNQNEQYFVCYNPNDLEDRRLRTSTGRDCGKTILGIFPK